MGTGRENTFRKTQKDNSTISFNQWRRSSYSVFSTLGKAVRIAVLAIVYVLNLAPLKAQVDTVEVLIK